MTITKNGRHQADEPGWWARRTKKAKVGIVTTALLTVSLTAWAVIMATVGMTSNTFEFTIDATADVTVTDAVFSDTLSAEVGDCTGSFTSTAFSVDTWDNFAPGAKCKVQLTLGIANANDDIYAADVVIADSLVTGTLLNTTGCKLVTDGSTIRLDLDVDPSITAAGTYSWALATGDEIVFTNDPAEGDCTSAT